MNIINSGLNLLHFGLHISLKLGLAPPSFDQPNQHHGIFRVLINPGMGMRKWRNEEIE